MGNASKKEKQNVINIEFMTAAQKLKKDQVIGKYDQEKDQQEENDDVIMVQNYQQYYQVDFRKTLCVSDSEISLKHILNLIINPDIKTPNHLLSICSFYTTRVKSYQIFFNNQEFTKEQQTYKFQYEPLQVEVIYKPKHWLQRVGGTMKDIGQKITRTLTMISKVAYVVMPFYTAIASLQPFILPTLSTAAVALKGVDNPRAKQASSAVKFLINLINKAVVLSAPMLRIVTKYFPHSKQYTMLFGLILGRGAFFNCLKLGITIFLPFLSPFLMMLG